MSGIRLAEAARSRDNNFDVVRLFAAALVLFAHSFPLSGHRDLLHRHTLGTAGVEIFFVTSGFLVTRSWVSEPNVRRFLKKRALRIFPGLACALVVTTLVLGPGFGGLGLLASSAPWDYIFSNLSLLVSSFRLPGVFASNPIQAMNGSLWTLPLEFRAYLLLALFGLAGFVRGRILVPAALLLLGSAAILGASPSGRLFAMFVAGSAFYLVRDRITLRVDVALLLLGIWLAAYATRFDVAAGIVTLPYLVSFAAYATPSTLHRLVAKGDVSYGVYIYAFPVQQAVVATLGPISPFLLLLVAAPIVWLLGLASWRFVEQPMLRLKARSPAATESRPVLA